MDKEPTNYKLITGHPDEVDRRVSSMVKVGWHPYGPTHVALDTNQSGNSLASQALVRYD